MIIERVSNWLSLSKQYFFTYKDGFFNLSFLANSPEVILESARKMPFVRYDENLQIVSSDSMFLNNSVQYAELEEGLWIMNSISKYKNNLSFTAIYDTFLPADYYYLSLNLVHNSLQQDSLFLVNKNKIKNQSLVFCKPKEHVKDYHFKGAREEFYTLYFSEDWLQKNLLNSTNFSKRITSVFDNTNENYLVFENLDSELVDKLSQSFNTQTSPDLFTLKRLTFDFFELFFDKIKNQGINESARIPEKDRVKMLKIEHYLANNLYSKFVGIDFLAEKYKISPTKLKQSFKLFYGKPVFQYFQDQRMSLALTYLESSDLKIKDIAKKFDYENVSKFSKAFQKYHNKLPSQIR